MNIVFSRPIWSDTQPKNGRQTPLSTRSMVSANVSAGSVSPISDTGRVSILKSLAIGPSWATAIRPPAPTMTNMAYITQNTGVLQHLGGTKVALALRNGGDRHGRDLARIRCPQEQREDDDDDALADAEPEERRFVAARADHVGDRDHGQRRAGAEAGGRQAGGESAPVGEPFQRVADRTAIDDAGADAADRGGDVEHGKRTRHRR